MNRAPPGHAKGWEAPSDVLKNGETYIVQERGPGVGASLAS